MKAESVPSISAWEKLVNFSTIARDCGVSSHTIQGYFQILVDTLLGRWLPAFRLRPKRRVIAAPKSYFSDVCVVNFLARRGQLEAGSELFGKAFENWASRLAAGLDPLSVDEGEGRGEGPSATLLCSSMAQRAGSHVITSAGSPGSATVTRPDALAG